MNSNSIRNILKYKNLDSLEKLKNERIKNYSFFKIIIQEIFSFYADIRIYIHDKKNRELFSKSCLEINDIKIKQINNIEKSVHNENYDGIFSCINKDLDYCYNQKYFINFSNEENLLYIYVRNNSCNSYEYQCNFKLYINLNAFKLIRDNLLFLSTFNFELYWLDVEMIIENFKNQENTNLNYIATFKNKISNFDIINNDCIIVSIGVIHQSLLMKKCSDKNSVFIINFKNSKIIYSFDEFSYIAYGLSSTSVALCNKDWSISIYGTTFLLNDFKLIKKLKSDSFIQILLILDFPLFLSYHENNKINLWNYLKGNLIQTYEFKQTLKKIFSFSKNFFLCQQENNLTYIFNSEIKRELFSFIPDSNDQIFFFLVDEEKFKMKTEVVHKSEVFKILSFK